MLLVGNKTFDSECVLRLGREEREALEDNFQRFVSKAGHSILSCVSIRPQFQLRLYRALVIYVNAPLMVIVLLCTLTYALAIIRAMRSKAVGRKSHSLILNRVAADLIFTLGLLALQVNDQLSWTFIGSEVFYVTSWASLYASIITYLTLAFLKLFAIFKPLDYQQQVTRGGCSS